jgi:hypothetical protein
MINHKLLTINHVMSVVGATFMAPVVECRYFDNIDYRQNGRHEGGPYDILHLGE